MSNNEIVSGVINNIWPHVLAAERATGSTLYRKIFAANTNDADETLISPALWNDIVTPAGDYIIMFPGTQTDTQATFAGYSGKIYGCAVLAADITAGGSTFSVKLEDASIAGIFSDGDTIRLTDMADPESSTGTEEILTVSGTPALSGLTLTITVVETIANDYTTASGSRAMSMYDTGDVVATTGPVTVTSASGTYDDST
jgi:hypothetical protein